jgi:Peptidase family M28/WD40-like Beta Propeller Repeat
MRLALAFLLALPAVAAGQVTTPKPAPRAAQVPVVRQVRETPPASAERWDRAYFAWDAGRYPDALDDLKQILAAPDAAAFHDRIAELTGERWRTIEVAKDARAPRWSPDGRHLAFETGTGAARRVKVVRTEAGFPAALEAAGGTPTFSPDGRVVAWVQQAANGRPSIMWSRLDGSAPEALALDAGAATGLTLLGRAPLQLAVITGNAGDSTATLRVRDLTGGDGTWRTLALQRGQPVRIVQSANGQRAFVITGDRGAFARSIPGFAAGARTSGFAVLDPAASAPLAVAEGTVLAVSADGQSYAFTTTSLTTTVISAVRGSAAPVEVHRSATPVQALAMAPDGSRVAWQTMLREDWELLAAPATANAEPQRVTREIQHDLQPQFLSPTRLLGLIGEARHRRSHLYDLESGVRTRLFHNNSVRTVAPEYEWVPSPEGTRVAIVAERDGDTVTPHRHLFLTDLSVPVTKAELVARVDSNLTAERALRAAGERMFAPIALAVRDATSAVDVGRIYTYEKDLFSFDSKHITQPGNARAVRYLLDTYRSFGLEAHLQPFRTLAGTEIEVANVVAVVRGTVNPELVYVVGAHFDSRAEGPGADDNTSGTAMILEAARVLAGRPQPATVMFVSFTGEEAGLRGAREFGRRMKDSIQVVGALNNDMMGWANDHRMDNTIRYSNPGIRDLQHAAAIQFSRLITYDAFYYKSTDAQALFDAWGDIIGGIGSYPILGNPHYHMPHDVLETINHQQLAETSRATVATIMLLASSPSRLNGLTAAGRTVTWSAAREKGVARYIVRYGPASDPMRFAATVTAPRATLPSLRPGWHVAVKAVNARGLEGWDWARAEVK